MSKLDKLSQPIRPNTGLNKLSQPIQVVDTCPCDRCPDVGACTFDTVCYDYDNWEKRRK